MTDAERMLLSDAIKTAIEAERKAIVWRRIGIFTGALAAISFVLLLVL